MENNSIRAKGTYRVIESKDYELIQVWNTIIAKENAKDENVWYAILNLLLCFNIFLFGLCHHFELIHENGLLFWMAFSTRTARERWKLVKNISKIGLQRHTTNDENEVRNESILTSILFENRF